MAEDIKSANERNITRMLEDQSRLLEKRKRARGGLEGGAYAPVPGSRAASIEAARAGDDTAEGGSVGVEPAGAGTRAAKPASAPAPASRRAARPSVGLSDPRIIDPEDEDDIPF